MNLKGYVSVASQVPVSVQNMVVRAYCERNGHTYSLSDVEFLTGHAMLEGMAWQSFDGVCAYSLWIMPQEWARPSGKEIHFALENYASPRDFETISLIWRIREAMK